MTNPKIAIIIGSTRETRFGHKPAEWIYELAARRSDIDAEIVDLRDFPLPFFEEVASNAWMPSKGEVAQRWQTKVGEFDGYIFITAEYNHSITAVLKNALDNAYTEWVRKPAAFVGYGSVGGARAVEQLRLIAVELQLAPTKVAVHIQGNDFREARQGKSLADMELLQPNAHALIDDLLWWANALKVAREATAK